MGISLALHNIKNVKLMPLVLIFIFCQYMYMKIKNYCNDLNKCAVHSIV